MILKLWINFFMKKEMKIIIFLFLTASVLFFYIFMNSRTVVVSQDSDQKNGEDKESVKKVLSMNEIEADYKENTKMIFKDYEEIIGSNNNFLGDNEKIEKMNKLESDLMGLTVPAEFKSLHFNFVLALNKIESYAENGDEDDMNKGFSMIEDIKNQYTWIN